VGKNKNLDYFLAFKHSIILEHIRDHSATSRKQKKIFEMLCSEKSFIRFGSSDIFSKAQFISRDLIISETIKTGLGLLEKYRSAAVETATRNYRYIFKIKRRRFITGLSSFFILPLTIKDRKKLITLLSSFGLFKEDEKDYLDFSNFILLEKIDKRYLDIFPEKFIDGADQLLRTDNPGEMAEKAIKKFLSAFIKSPRYRNILKSYYGLKGDRRLTRREISKKYKISPARVEKIVRRISNQLSFGNKNSENRQLTLGLEIRPEDKLYYGLFSLAVLFLIVIFKKMGKVYSIGKDEEIPHSYFLKIMFVFRLLGIPIYRVIGMDTYVLGVSNETGKKIKALALGKGRKKLRKIIDSEDLKSHIFSIKHLFLTMDEIEKLSIRINEHIDETARIREIAYAALKKINRPAHYSEITRVCNTMFSERVFTSSQIHGSLASRSQELYVWIGLRGVYALKEWGFKRPDRSLYQAVREIIEAEFGRTSRPVSLNHIYKEIGKYRKIVNENSLYFACNFNPKIKVLKKDMFIPDKMSEDEPGDAGMDSKKDIKFLNELDRQFRKNS